MVARQNGLFLASAAPGWSTVNQDTEKSSKCSLPLAAIM